MIGSGDDAVASHQVALKPVGRRAGHHVRVATPLGAMTRRGAGLAGIARAVLGQVCSSALMFGAPHLLAAIYTEDPAFRRGGAFASWRQSGRKSRRAASCGARGYRSAHCSKTSSSVQSNLRSRAIPAVTVAEAPPQNKRHADSVSTARQTAALKLPPCSARAAGPDIKSDMKKCNWRTEEFYGAPVADRRLGPCDCLLMWNKKRPSTGLAWTLSAPPPWTFCARLAVFPWTFYASLIAKESNNPSNSLRRKGPSLRRGRQTVTVPTWQKFTSSFYSMALRKHAAMP
jgi:hypothetical protein